MINTPDYTIPNPDGVPVVEEPIIIDEDDIDGPGKVEDTPSVTPNKENSSLRRI